MNKPTLQIIVGSTRPGRVGLSVAEWIADVARHRGGFEVELVDLAEVGLPLLDEPNHPRLHDYQHEHTRRWSETIERGDAFVFVVPEYNHSFNAATKNALDYLHREWQDKPVGLVTYGGVSAGTRSANHLKVVLGALKMIPITEAVNIPFVNQFIDDDGRFVPNEITEGAAEVMLGQLDRWTGLLAPSRALAS